MRTRPRGLSAAVFLCAALTAGAQSPPADVCVELRVVSVGGKESREAVANLFEGKCKESKTAFLTEKELFAVLEKCAADRTTNILQAPKITAEAGKPATVTLLDTTMYTTAVTVKAVNGKVVYLPTNEAVETGTKFNVTATPSKDGKFVELTMSYRDKQAKPNTQLFPVTTLVTPEFTDGNKGQPVPFTQFVQMPKFDELKADAKGMVPDGGTMAVKAGTRTVRVKREFGPPVLTHIPYLNRLFKNTCEAECDVVVFATATRVKEVAKVVPVAAWSPAGNDEVAKLVAAYHKACAAGNTDEARRLAVQALAKDPTCFGR